MFEKIVEFSDMVFDQFFSRFVVAVVILLIGLIIGKLVGRLVFKFFKEIELDKIIKKAGFKFSLGLSLSHFITYFIYFVSVVWALNELGLTTTVLNMISAAALILIIISILLAIKDFLPNLIAGFFIYQRDLIKEGDRVRVDKIQGKVSKISLIETEITTKSGDLLYVPNSILVKKEFVKKKSK